MFIPESPSGLAAGCPSHNGAAEPAGSLGRPRGAFYDAVITIARPSENLTPRAPVSPTPFFVIEHAKCKTGPAA